MGVIGWGYAKDVILKEMAANAMRRVARAYPTPHVFVRVADKGLTLEASVGVANTGLKVIGFSISCEWSVRVARRRLTRPRFCAKGHFAGFEGVGRGVIG